MRVLHVGAGMETNIPTCFDGWDVFKLDIDPRMKPDILADILDMGNVGKFDGLYSCHVLEHVYPHEVDVALKEFKRVLYDDAICMTFVPDLEGVKADNEVLYKTGSGLGVSGLDLIYGHRVCIEQSKHMAHHTGFIKETLEKAFRDAGFEAVRILRYLSHNLFITAFPKKLTPKKAKEYEALFSKHETFMEIKHG